MRGYLMSSIAMWLSALASLSVAMMARAEIVQVTLSGTISQVAPPSPGETVPELAVGTPFVWSFSYTTAGVSYQNQPIGNPLSASTLTIGSSVWNTGASTYSMAYVYLQPLQLSSIQMAGPGIPTVPADIDGSFDPGSFSWFITAPVLQSLPTAAQLATWVATTSQTQTSFGFTSHARQMSASSDNAAVSINGVVVPPPPPAPFTLTPATLSFGVAAIGMTASMPVVVTNVSTAPISLGAITASSNFSQTNNCATELPAGGQCNIAANFSPTGAGGLVGTILIPYGGYQYAVLVSGVAPVAVTISPSASTAAVGQPVTLTWTGSTNTTCTASSSSTTSSFTGNVPSSGSAVVNETTAGTDTYIIHCTAPGTQEVDQSTSVVWTWPPITTTVTATPPTITAGQSTTLSWQSANATTCIASGGGSDDGWAGTKATSGTQTVTEPVELAVPSATLTFGLTCTSTPSGLSGNGSASVVVDQQPAAKSGGGGAFDARALFMLFGILLWRLQRKMTGSSESWGL
jgi:Abnormal spindle-like microcephaly-assoc'd, ASPM-SPD-2-Hydin